MKTTKLLILALAVEMVCGFAVPLPAAPIPITITNASFEDPALSVNASTYSIPGWNKLTLDPSLGVYRPSASIYPGGVPDGVNAAFLWPNTGTIWQATSKTVSTNDDAYILSVYVGRRAGGDPQPDTTLEIRSGSTYVGSTLLESLLVARNTVAVGTFSNFTFSFDRSDPTFASLVTAHQGENLIVAFATSNVVSGDESDLDLVQFSFIPEPGTVALLGLAGALLLTRSRRSRY